MADLRSALEEAMEQSEDGTLETPRETNIEYDDDPIRNEKDNLLVVKANKRQKLNKLKKKKLLKK